MGAKGSQALSGKEATAWRWFDLALVRTLERHGTEGLSLFAKMGTMSFTQASAVESASGRSVAFWWGLTRQRRALPLLDS